MAKFILKNYGHYHSGNNVNVVLFESGIISNTVPYQVTNISKSNFSDHAERMASLLVGEFGVAKNINLFCLNFNECFPDRYFESLRDIEKKYGKIHITLHPYSCKEDLFLFKYARKQFDKNLSKPNDGHIMIASAGHDGHNSLRYPASPQSVLSVGVCDHKKKPKPYSSTRTFDNKPDIYIEDNTYFCGTWNGEKKFINGTSAAAGIAAGLASLWCEKLLLNNLQFNTTLLKGLIINSTREILNTDNNFQVSTLRDEEISIYQDYLMNSKSKFIFKAKCKCSFKFTCISTSIYSEKIGHLLRPKIKLQVNHRTKKVTLQDDEYISYQIKLLAGELVEICISSNFYKIEFFLILFGNVIEVNNEQNKK